jgi:drug/metabolite transporter (DMT)-like permease
MQRVQNRRSVIEAAKMNKMTVQSMGKADGAALDRGAGRVSSTYNMIGVLLAAAGSVAFSLRAIFVKLAYEDMSDPATLLALRMMFSLPFSVIAMWLHRRHATGRSRPRITGRDVLILTGLGFIGYYLSSLLDMTGVFSSWPPALAACCCSSIRRSS